MSTKTCASGSKAKSSLLMTLIISLIATLAIGCGSSREDFVFTGTGGGQQATGGLIFNFAQAQGVLNVPQGTTTLQFEFFNQQGQKTIADVVRAFATPIVIENIPTNTTSTRITARDSDGAPLAQTSLSVVVFPGVNTEVDVSGATTVPVVVDALTVSPAAETIQVGQTQSYTASASFSNGDVLLVQTFLGTSFASSDTNVATIGLDGLATANAAGSTQITATYRGVTSPAATLTVEGVQPPEGLVSIAITGAVVNGTEVDPASVSIPVNGMVAYTATGTFEDETSRQLTPADGITWQTSAAAVATVQGNTYTGVSNGTTQVTATVGTIVSPPVSLTVTPPTPPITLVNVLVEGPAQAEVNTTATFVVQGVFSNGVTRAFTADDEVTIEWTSSDEDVAALASETVSSATFDALAVGNTTIEATVSGEGFEFSDDALLDVVPPGELANLESFSVAEETLFFQLGTNSTANLVATGEFSDNTTATITNAGNGLEYTSSHSSVTVDNNGLVTAVAPTNGTPVIITATALDNDGATVNSSNEVSVTVAAEPPPAPVFSLNSGATITLQDAAPGNLYTLVLLEGTDEVPYTQWNGVSNDTGVVTINNTNGLLTATGNPGDSTTVDIFQVGNPDAILTLTVNITDATAESLTVNGPYTLEVGETASFSATLTYPGGATVQNAQFLDGFDMIAPAAGDSAVNNVALVNNSRGIAGLMSTAALTNPGVAFEVPALATSADVSVTVTALPLTSYTVEVAGNTVANNDTVSVPEGFNAGFEVVGTFGTQPDNTVTRTLIPGVDYTAGVTSATFVLAGSEVNGVATSEGDSGVLLLSGFPNGQPATTINLSAVSDNLNGISASFTSGDNRLLFVGVATETAAQELDVRGDFADAPNFRVANANVNLTADIGNVNIALNQLPARYRHTGDGTANSGTLLPWPTVRLAGVSAATGEIIEVTVGTETVEVTADAVEADSVDLEFDPASTDPGVSRTVTTVITIGGVEESGNALLSPSLQAGFSNVRFSENADGSLTLFNTGTPAGDIDATDDINRSYDTSGL